MEAGYPPPPTKGYLSDTCAISYENEAKCVQYPPLRCYLERVLCDMGGVSRIGPLRSGGFGGGSFQGEHLKIGLCGDFQRAAPDLPEFAPPAAGRSVAGVSSTRGCEFV